MLHGCVPGTRGCGSSLWGRPAEIQTCARPWGFGDVLRGAASFPPCWEVVSTPAGGRASLLPTCAGDPGHKVTWEREVMRGRRTAPPAGAFRESQTPLEPFSVFLEKAGGAGDAALSDGVLGETGHTRQSWCAPGSGGGGHRVGPQRAPACRRGSPARTRTPLPPLALLPSAPRSVGSREGRDKPASCVTVQKPARSFLRPQDRNTSPLPSKTQCRRRSSGTARPDATGQGRSARRS